MRTKTTKQTYDFLCKMLSDHTKVYYSRYGDGDFNIMNGKREKMHRWSPELQKELRESFAIDHPQYIKGCMVNYPVEVGMSHGVFLPATNNSEIENWLINNQKVPEETVFESHIMFHYISVFQPNLMIDFLNKYIRPKKKLFIGSVPKDKVERLVGPIDFYVSVPHKDAYYEIDFWWPKVIEYIDNVELCLPAAGMAGRVIQKRLWELNKDIHSIDLGSVIDAACEVKTRTWIAKVGNTIDKLLI